MTVTFSRFATEACCDFLRIYTSSAADAAAAYSYSGTQTIGTLVLTTSYVRFQWTTDGSVVSTGFQFTFQVTTPAPSFAVQAVAVNGSVSRQYLVFTVPVPGDYDLWIWNANNQTDMLTVPVEAWPLRTHTRAGVVAAISTFALSSLDFPPHHCHRSPFHLPHLPLLVWVLGWLRLVGWLAGFVVTCW